MSGMVERVARAILAERGIIFQSKVLPDDAIWLAFSKDQAFKEARAAIAAMREPTDDMHDAAIATHVRENGGIEHAPNLSWKAMIDVALKDG